MSADAPAATRKATRLRIAVVGLGVAIVAVVALLSAASSGDAPPAAFTTEPGSFALPALEGDGRVELADFEGRPLVVNFFASWCGPCEEELPHFAEAARKLEGKVAFIAVNSQELRPAAGVALARRMRLEESGITLARDVGGRVDSGLHDALGRGMPLNAFYDADGRLLDVTRGALVDNRLREEVQRIFGVTF